MAVGIFASSLFGFIAQVPVDARMSERHRLSATPSQFALEDNSVVSDHLILNPDTVAITFELNNQDLLLPILNTSLGSGSYGIRSATLYQLLRERLNSRQLFTIVTRHNIYTSMALVELNADHVSPGRGTLRGVAKFQRMRLTSLETVSIPTSQLAQDGTQYKASSTVPLGSQVLSDVNSQPNLLDQVNNAFEVVAEVS